MWKLILAFILFAAVAMYFLSKSGSGLDISGEKHGIEAPVSTPEAASAPASAASSS